MAERFEDRHRELRAQAAGRMPGPSAIPLVRFNRATSGLVDDLVAAVRRDFELNDAIVDEQDERRKTDLVNQRIADRGPRRPSDHPVRARRGVRHCVEKRGGRWPEVERG